MTNPFLIRTTPTTTPILPPPLHLTQSASVLPQLSHLCRGGTQTASAGSTFSSTSWSSSSAAPPTSQTTSTTQLGALQHHSPPPAREPAALDSLRFMASLHQRQIGAPSGLASPTPLPSIAQALAVGPPPMGPSSPPHRHRIQLPPLTSLFAPPQPQRQAHIIDGLCPVQTQARPNHLGDSGVVRPQPRPRAVPSVIHLKNQANAGASSSHLPGQQQQPRPRRQQSLDWIDLTCNVEEEEKYDRKLQLPPFTSSHRGHGTRCIRFGSAADDGPELGATPKTTADGEVEKRCAHCGTRSTPEWRRGPTGRGTLCNACGLKYTKTLQAQRRKGKTGSTLGAVPLASLLNGPEDRKRRTSLSSPMVWQTKVKNFVSSSPSPSSSSSSPSSSSSSTTLSASFPPARLLGGASSLSSFSVSPPTSSGSGFAPRKRARTQSLPNPPTHQ